MKPKTRVWSVRLLTAAIAVVAVVVVKAQSNQRQSPLPAYYFEVEIGGIKYPFRSCSGLKIETAVVEYEEGGNTGTIRKFAGATRYGNIRLSRIFTGDRSLYDWARNIKKPNPAKVNGRIVLYDRQNNKVAEWEFQNGWPVKWETSEMDSDQSGMAIETIEIAVEKIESA